MVFVILYPAVIGVKIIISTHLIKSYAKGTVLLLPETIKEKSTFQAKALLQEVSSDLLTVAI